MKFFFNIFRHHRRVCLQHGGPGAKSFNGATPQPEDGAEGGGLVPPQEAGSVAPTQRRLDS